MQISRCCVSWPSSVSSASRASGSRVCWRSADIDRTALSNPLDVAHEDQAQHEPDCGCRENESVAEVRARRLVEVIQKLTGEGRPEHLRKRERNVEQRHVLGSGVVTV